MWVRGSRCCSSKDIKDYQAVQDQVLTAARRRHVTTLVSPTDQPMVTDTNRRLVQALSVQSMIHWDSAGEGVFAQTVYNSIPWLHITGSARHGSENRCRRTFDGDKYTHTGNINNIISRFHDVFDSRSGGAVCYAVSDWSEHRCHVRAHTHLFFVAKMMSALTSLDGVVPALVSTDSRVSERATRPGDKEAGVVAMVTAVGVDEEDRSDVTSGRRVSDVARHRPWPGP